MKFIEDSTLVRVRFSESDAMGVVWHGNYLKYFEDGRESLGKKFEMTYQDMYAKGFVVPIVNANLSYKAPIQFGDEMEITTKLIFTQAAKLIYEYKVYNLSSKKLSCVGKTEQVFLKESSRSLELFMPQFYKDWLNRIKWQTQ